MCTAILVIIVVLFVITICLMPFYEWVGKFLSKYDKSN